MENLIPLIILGVIGLIGLGIVWYIVTRFLVNIGARKSASKNGVIWDAKWRKDVLSQPKARSVFKPTF